MAFKMKVTRRRNDISAPILWRVSNVALVTALIIAIAAFIANIEESAGHAIGAAMLAVMPVCTFRYIFFGRP